MTPGKAAAQAGHAFLDSFSKSPHFLARAYLGDGHGTKVVLVAPDEAAIRDSYDLASARGLPCALIVDSGHIMPPHFDGAPVVTAVGIGPVTRDEVRGITDNFGCYR